MAFTIDETVIHVKLTDKGRELLSRGQLTFNQFAIGDSEIDYNFIRNNNLDPSTSEILRPFDRNPNIVTFITQEVSGNTFIALPSVVSNTSVITNTPPSRGMFTVTGSTPTLIDDPQHTKQSNMQIAISGVTGGSTVLLNQSPEYGANPTEPVVGDYVFVRWVNPDMSASTVNFNIDIATPHLFYKIENILSGSLSSNNLIVQLDRNLPNFSSSASTLIAGAVLYPNNNGRLISGDSIQNYYGAPFITDFITEAMIAFVENFDTPTINVPVWNMTIVFTEEIVGIQSGNKKISQLPSASYGGFVQYVQRLNPTVKNLGIIHYTNLSPSNNYGEGLVVSNSTVPTLDLPTIMWHKNTGQTIGMRLTADFASQGSLSGLSTVYYNLVDQYGNIVGKVLSDLKIVIIEDQELLFAMSYKSNRNWTLPSINTEFNIQECPDTNINIVVVNP